MKSFNVKSVDFIANGTAIVRNGKEIELERFSVDVDSKNARDIKRVVCDSFENVRAADVVIENVERLETVTTYTFDVTAQEIVDALIQAGYDYTESVK